MRRRAALALLASWAVLYGLLLAVRASRAEPGASAGGAAASNDAGPGLESGIESAHPVSPPDFRFVDATWDRPIRVLLAATPGTRALVYLHGYCGDVNALGAFVPAATAHGTVIALLGDQPCPGRPGRFKWSNDIRGLDGRIKRAVRRVNRAYGLRLDVHDITLFGYSQGASRAESLARYYAGYPRVILGGPPRRPKPAHFTQTRAVAVFGGELEDTHDMLGGADDLVAAGVSAHFFLLPGVDHGDFGGEDAGNRALREILDFVLSREPSRPLSPPASGLPEALRLP